MEDNPYNWTRQRMLLEIENLNREVDRLKLVEIENKKLRKKYKLLKKSIIGINLYSIKTLQTIC